MKRLWRWMFVWVSAASLLLCILLIAMGFATGHMIFRESYNAGSLQDRALVCVWDAHRAVVSYRRKFLWMATNSQPGWFANKGWKFDPVEHHMPVSLFDFQQPNLRWFPVDFKHDENYNPGVRAITYSGWAIGIGLWFAIPLTAVCPTFWLLRHSLAKRQGGFEPLMPP